MAYVWIVGLLYVTSLPVGGQTKCSVDEVQGCVGGFHNVTARAQVLFPPLTNSEYEEMCRKWGHSKLCFEKLQPCQPSMEQKYRNTADLLKYACTEGFIYYVETGRVCLENVVTQASLSACSSSYITKLTAVLDAAHLNRQDKQAFCAETLDVLRCRYLVLLDHCDEDAARWQHMVQFTSLSEALRKSGCTQDLGKNFKVSLQWVPVERLALWVVFVAFFGLILLCAMPIRIFCCLAEDRHRQDRRRRRSLHQQQQKQQKQQLQQELPQQQQQELQPQLQQQRQQQRIMPHHKQLQQQQLQQQQQQQRKPDVWGRSRGKPENTNDSVFFTRDSGSFGTMTSAITGSLQPTYMPACKVP